MGIHTNFFVSDQRIAFQYEDDPSQFDPHTAHYKGITEAQLSVLWACVEQVDWHESMMSFRCVSSIDGGEVTIHQLPEQLIQQLAHVDESALNDVAAQWAATEEMQPYAADSVREILVNLIRLSKHAVESEQSVFLWTCV